MFLRGTANPDSDDEKKRLTEFLKSPEIRKQSRRKKDKERNIMRNGLLSGSEVLFDIK